MNSDVNKAVEWLRLRIQENDRYIANFRDGEAVPCNPTLQEENQYLRIYLEALTSQSEMPPLLMVSEDGKVTPVVSEMTLPELPEGWSYDELTFNEDLWTAELLTDDFQFCSEGFGKTPRAAVMDAIAQITPPQKDNTDGQ